VTDDEFAQLKEVGNTSDEEATVDAFSYRHLIQTIEVYDALLREAEPLIFGDPYLLDRIHTACGIDKTSVRPKEYA
jgi:hypothetical protein